MRLKKNPDFIAFFIYLGGITLQFINGYSSGNFDDDQKICQTMEVQHETFLPQDSESPFIVEPDSITVSNSDVGKIFEVSLISTIKSKPFNGFMLEARRSETNPPEGNFSVLNTDFSRLQTCNGKPNKAVTHTDNRKKTEIRVKWSVSEPGKYHFRATFTETYSKFWLRKEFVDPTLTPTFTPVTTPLKTTTSPTTTSTTSPTTKSTSTTYTSTRPSLSTQVPTTSPVKPHLSVPLTLLLLSSLTLTVSVPFLIKPRKLVLIKVISVVSLGLSFAAFIILLIQSRVKHSIVTGFAVALNMGQTILIFCFCGPSHELRKICCWVLRLGAFVNVCFTNAAIFVALIEGKKSCCWLPALLGVYLACQLLLYVIFLYDEVKQNNWLQTNGILGKRVSCWHVSAISFGVVNILFTTALLSGIYLCLSERL